MRSTSHRDRTVFGAIMSLTGVRWNGRYCSVIGGLLLTLAADWLFSRWSRSVLGGVRAVFWISSVSGQQFPFSRRDRNIRCYKMRNSYVFLENIFREIYLMQHFLHKFKIFEHKH